MLLDAFLRYHLNHLHDLFHNLWNGNIDDLLQMSRFLSTCCTNQIQQLNRQFCTLLWHETALCEDLMKRRYIEQLEDFPCLGPDENKKSDSSCLLKVL